MISRKIIEPKLDDTQCGFRRCRSTADQICALQQIFDKCWEIPKLTCFVDLGKGYNRVPREKLWGVLVEYGVDGCLLLAFK